MIDKLLKHPIWTALGTIVAIIALLVPFIQPIYELVEDAELCGTRQVSTTLAPVDEFNLCRDVTHGVDYYQYTERVSGSSGWRGGGYNPLAWCEDVKRTKENAVEQSITWGTPEPRERSRMTWDRHAEYNYDCIIEASWGPIYKEGRSRECGASQPVIKVENLPKTCPNRELQIGLRVFGLSWTGWPW